MDALNARIEGLKNEQNEELAVLKKQTRQIRYELRESQRGFWSKLLGQKKPERRGKTSVRQRAG